MAKCEEGYLCDVCGQDVEEISDSDLYLRYVIGMLDPEVLHTTPERHVRCNPTLAQFITDTEFEAVVVEGDFDKRHLDPAFVATHHVVRIILVVVLAPLAFRLLGLGRAGSAPARDRPG